ncbi:MAG TPA: acetyltransferase [Burkholderiales bacterium]|nr:acetyltransferase [Burkholderiales bacterium]
MSTYDIFNGDADGLFALHQLRLHDPRDAILVSGAKREIRLVERVQAKVGDRLTVLDISMNENRDALMRALSAGAFCVYFDHHYPGDILRHERLETHIHYAADTCTSAIVDGYLAGRYRSWAVAAAFGDNIPSLATRLGQSMNLSEGQLKALDELGRLVNYNAYGSRVEELHLDPIALYRRIRPYVDPLEFVARDPAFSQLKGGYHLDLALAREVKPVLETPHHLAIVLPDAAWSRRISGAFANQLAQEQPRRAIAVAVPQAEVYGVSIRAPLIRPTGADVLARGFASGGGRPGAAGINRLEPADLTRFFEEFRRSFATP